MGSLGRVYSGGEIGYARIISYSLFDLVYQGKFCLKPCLFML